jgi:antitoxin ParD1/3/4
MGDGGKGTDISANMPRRIAAFYSHCRSELQEKIPQSKFSVVDKYWQSLPSLSQEVLAMATMNVSLPDAMKYWVEQQAQSGRYSNVSDYVRDLIRRDQDQARKVASMQSLVTEGIESGAGTRTMDELLKVARSRASGT